MKLDGVPPVGCLRISVSGLKYSPILVSEPIDCRVLSNHNSIFRHLFNFEAVRQRAGRAGERCSALRGSWLRPKAHSVAQEGKSYWNLQKGFLNEFYIPERHDPLDTTRPPTWVCNSWGFSGWWSRLGTLCILGVCSILRKARVLSQYVKGCACLGLQLVMMHLNRKQVSYLQWLLL